MFCCSCKDSHQQTLLLIITENCGTLNNFIFVFRATRSPIKIVNMKFLWFMLFAVAAILMKENSCGPAIPPLSQHAILYPEDNWDDCFLDKASTRPGVCKRLHDCPEALKKWDKQNIYPKTCYFIKEQHFVCCPLATSSNEQFASTTVKFHNIFLTSPSGISTTKEPTGNIFLNNVRTTTEGLPHDLLAIFQNWETSATKRPSNIFLDNLNVDKPTSRKPPLSTDIADIFNTEKASFIKRRSEIECELQNQQKFEAIDTNGPFSEINEFPFMAAIGLKSGSDNKFWYACGGVLISPRFVLTAAHCAELGSPAVVHLGDDSLNNSQEGTIKIKRFITHPGYNTTTIYNDVALVELEQEVDNPFACLWTAHELPTIQLTALGYGQASFEILNPNQLFKASLTVIDKPECQDYYKVNKELEITDIVDANLCAGGIENTRNSCQGDSGGPLIMELDKIFYVVGLTSFGLGCDDLPPTIFARVSSFIDWIEPVVWPDIDVRVGGK